MPVAYPIIITRVIAAANIPPGTLAGYAGILRLTP